MPNNGDNMKDGRPIVQTTSQVMRSLRQQRDDLLAALKPIADMDIFTNHDTHEQGRWRDAAREAIAKAKEVPTS